LLSNFLSDSPAHLQASSARCQASSALCSALLLASKILCQIHLLTCEPTVFCSLSSLSCSLSSSPPCYYLMISVGPAYRVRSNPTRDGFLGQSSWESNWTDRNRSIFLKKPYDFKAKPKLHEAVSIYIQPHLLTVHSVQPHFLHVLHQLLSALSNPICSKCLASFCHFLALASFCIASPDGFQSSSDQLAVSTAIFTDDLMSSLLRYWSLVSVQEKVKNYSLCAYFGS
jgi:hypothetical protein